MTEQLFSQSPIECEHALSFEKKIEYGCPTDFRFNLSFDGKDLYDFQENLEKNEGKELEVFFDRLKPYADALEKGYFNSVGETPVEDQISEE